MKFNIVKIHKGTLVDDEKKIGLIQLCRYCNISTDHLIEMVNEGIIEPVGTRKSNWKFSFDTIHQINRIKRLQRDLDLNLPGVALVLHLLHRIDDLESKRNTYFME